MFKRISAIVLALLILTAPVAFAAGFTDFDDSHWAASAVNTLVDEGTIGGYPDGTYKPDGTVTRAEFVKMIGNGPTKFEKNFNDVDADFWAYDYIMNSGLEGDSSGNFNPNVPITRGDVLDLLWKRAGSPAEYVVPKIISDQGTSKAAIAWGYTTGIMGGNDGMMLRLSDTMSRAEGAVLIVRSRETNVTLRNFADTVSPSILKDVFESSMVLTEVAYDENRELTNGELSIISSRLRLDEHELAYYLLEPINPFPAPNNRTPYAPDLYLVGRDILGEDKVSLEFINARATLRDAVSVLAYSLSEPTNLNLGTNPTLKSENLLKLSSKDNYYKEITASLNENENKALTLAYQNDIMLEANKAFSPDSTVTMKELAAILLQFDHISGIFNKYIFEASETNFTTKIKTPANFDAASLPANREIYQFISKELPANIYVDKIPFNASRSPKKSFEHARDLYFVVSTGFVYLANKAKENGIEVRFTYYPALCFVDINGYDMRMKVEIISAPAGSKLSEIAKTEIDKSLSAGMEFFVDIKTNLREYGPELPISKLEIINVIES